MGGTYPSSGGGGQVQTGRRPDEADSQQSLPGTRREDEVDEAYQEFAEDSGITEQQGEKISRRRNVIEDAVRDGLAVEDSQLIGSFTRDTVTGPLTEDTDADVMLVLDADKHQEWVEQEDGPRNCLRAVKRRIQNDPRFSETDVEIDRNVVRVKYHDSTVEVVPAFRYSKVPGAEHPKENPSIFDDANDGYAIPDTHDSSSWTGTNPRAYKERFEARDQAHDGKVSGLSRSMKKWAENNGVPVRGYTMEVMVYNYFEEKARTGEPVPDNHESLTRDFADSLPSRMAQDTREPIYDETVDSDMSPGEKQEASRRASELRDKLQKARRLREQGRTEEAKQVLNDAFEEGFN